MWLVAGLEAVAGIAVGIDRLVVSGDRQASRPDLQRTLDGLVTGATRSAPGVSAYVVGPEGRWTGAAGLANVETGAPMPTSQNATVECALCMDGVRDDARGCP